VIELNKIYCESNLETMAQMPDGFINLVVTSPPYDNLRSYNGYEFDFETVAKELYRITKQGGVVVWVVDDQMIDGSESLTSAEQKIYFRKGCGFNINDTMIYRKLNGSMGSQYQYLQEFEYMFILSKGYPATVNLLRDRRNVVHGDKSTPQRKSDANGSTQTRHIIERAEYGRRKNIWDYSVGGVQELGSDERHPAVFPEALAKDHILSWSNENDLIYDPFMGSGTTAKAAHLLNRNWIGSEISPEYVDLANRRLEPYLAQNSLF